MTMTGAAVVAGVTGWPVSHSLSPLLHGFWIEALGLNAAYVPFAIAPAHFETAVTGLRRAGVRGLNVTVPHKQAAFALATEIDTSAAVAGAANLLLFDGETIVARNTDGIGLVATLEAALGAGALAGKSALVLGAGGMARAAVIALSAMKLARIAVLARRPERARALTDELAPKLAATLTAADLAAWDALAPEAALVVNATSAGMRGRPDLALPLEALPATAAVFDSVYTPLQTGLLAAAAARGLIAIDGLGLLMHQAVPSFEAFYGHTPQITAALRIRLVEALGLG